MAQVVEVQILDGQIPARAAKGRSDRAGIIGKDEAGDASRTAVIVQR